MLKRLSPLRFAAEIGGVEVVEARRCPLYDRSVVGIFERTPESMLPIESLRDFEYDDTGKVVRGELFLPLEDCCLLATAPFINYTTIPKLTSLLSSSPEMR